MTLFNIGSRHRLRLSSFLLFLVILSPVKMVCHQNVQADTFNQADAFNAVYAFAGLASAFYLGRLYAEKTRSSVNDIAHQTAASPDITFKDVIGAHEAKAALLDILGMLKQPEKYKKLGASIPKGVLLEGPPGNGKTLLARALAGEAGVPFFYLNTADLSQGKWMGDGIQAVKQLFDLARKSASEYKKPVIIFLDELDALGKRSIEKGGGATTENNRTINTVLTEIDGFNHQQEYPIIVLGATNHKDAIDQALIRSGRIDTSVIVPLPDADDREQLVKLYNKKIRVSAELNFAEIVALSDGFSGADMANLVNQAALRAARRSAEYVEQIDFENALEQIKKSKKTTGQALNSTIIDVINSCINKL